MTNFEHLGQFYLGKVYDASKKERTDQLYLYDAKDLTTHAVCVGMTGSGKTGLCISLLEEAALDNIPALIIDPKGDMSNLFLTFPDFKGEDFLPWVSQTEADTQSISLEELADQTAKTWQAGLAEWGITGDRLQTLRDQADFGIYTPGSSAGQSLSMVQILQSPSQEIVNDPELMNDYCHGTVSSLLTLLNIEADPLTSRDYILLSNILLDQWKEGIDVDFPKLIECILHPPIQTIGVLDVESFYPEKDRQKLAMSFNNLLASPQFASWLQGEALDIQSLLYTEEGKARISIISINHLDDRERMFVVTAILNKMISWMRAQSGTSTLRAILYMDEIYGYFPPVAQPPSKQPLITLLKQARAYGLGLMLTTQNPADLDYKALSNIGTWFIGRLQTDQDKERLLDGLESTHPTNYDRASLSQVISDLPRRTFLVNNIHEDGPELFESRWAMSYLAGPLTRPQIEYLSKDKKNTQESQENSKNQEVMQDSKNQTSVIEDFNQEALIQEDLDQENSQASGRIDEPIFQKSANAGEAQAKVRKISSDIDQYFYPASQETGSPFLYLPSLLGLVEIYFDDEKKGLSHSEQVIMNTPIQDTLLPVDWSVKTSIEFDEKQMEKEADPQGQYGPLPDNVSKKSSFTAWEKEMVDYIYRNYSLDLYYNKTYQFYSQVHESLGDFQIRFDTKLKELRDIDIREMRKKYQKKLDSAQEKIRKAELAVEREMDQAKASKSSTLVNIGSTILDSFLGNKKFGKTTMNKAASSVRSANRARKQEGDVQRAEENLSAYQDDLKAIEEDLERELEALSSQFEEERKNIENIQVRPLKKNIQVRSFVLLWIESDQV